MLVHRDPRGDEWADVRVAGADDRVVADAFALAAPPARELLHAAAG